MRHVSVLALALLCMAASAQQTAPPSAAASGSHYLFIIRPGQAQAPTVDTREFSNQASCEAARKSIFEATGKSIKFVCMAK